MKSITLKPAKLFIWDLDNCIYPYDDAFHRACEEAAARAAVSLGFKDSGGGAIDLASQSYKKYGTSFDIFIREYGLPEAEMHRRYHEEVSTDFLKPDQRLLASSRQIAAATPEVTHVILTHGSTEWAKRVLAARGLSQFFQPEHIIGTEQLNFSRKCDGIHSFAHLLALTGHQAEDAIMVEDTAKNLKHPKAMGMQTVFISYGKGDGDGHADHVFPTVQDFLRAYQKQIPVPARNCN